MSESLQLLNQPQPVEKSESVQIISSSNAATIQAMVVSAKRDPRDETTKLSQILKSCQRVGLAEIAEYEYVRGGTKITGPSIDLLKAIAQRWGNILFGWKETERTNGESKCLAYAWDLQDNSRNEIEFSVRHWRDTRSGGYALKEERDIYEAISNMAARRMRACLEAVIPGDIVDSAVAACRKTLSSQHTEPLRDRVLQMLQAFEAMSVTPAMIERRLNNKIDAISENQLAGLRRIYKSLKDGVGTREEFFPTEPLPPKFETVKPPETSVKQPEDPRKSPPISRPAKSQGRSLPTAPEPPPQGEPEIPFEQAAAQPGPEPPPPPAPPAPAAPKERPSGPNYPKALRGLMRLGGITEPEMIAIMRKVLNTDETLRTLDEIAEISPESIQQAHDNWSMCCDQVKELRKAAKNVK